MEHADEASQGWLAARERWTGHGGRSPVDECDFHHNRGICSGRDGTGSRASARAGGRRSGSGSEEGRGQSITLRTFGSLLALVADVDGRLPGHELVIVRLVQRREVDVLAPEPSNGARDEVSVLPFPERRVPRKDK